MILRMQFSILSLKLKEKYNLTQKSVKITPKSVRLAALVYGKITTLWNGSYIRDEAIRYLNAQ